MSDAPLPKQGAKFQTAFYRKPKEDSAFPFRATHTQGKRAPKAVLYDDDRVVPGQLCEVRVTSVHKPRAKDRGSIEVALVRVDWRRPERGSVS